MGSRPFIRLGCRTVHRQKHQHDGEGADRHDNGKKRAGRSITVNAVIATSILGWVPALRNPSFDSIDSQLNNGWVAATRSTHATNFLISAYSSIDPAGKRSQPHRRRDDLTGRIVRPTLNVTHTQSCAPSWVIAIAMPQVYFSAPCG